MTWWSLSSNLKSSILDDFTTHFVVVEWSPISSLTHAFVPTLSKNELLLLHFPTIDLQNGKRLFKQWFTIHFFDWNMNVFASTGSLPSSFPFFLFDLVSNIYIFYFSLLSSSWFIYLFVIPIIFFFFFQETKTTMTRSSKLIIITCN